MAAQSVASRSPRSRQAAEPDDAVLARALAVSAWARKNIRMVIAGAVVALLLVGGLIYWRMYRADLEERAATEFVALRQSAAAGNLSLVSADLQRYIARFDGTVYSDEARILLGEMQLSAGEAAQAVTTLQVFPDRLNRTPLGAQGTLLLAAAQAAGGDTEAAIATYLNVAERSESDFRRVAALSNAATLREQAGDFAAAAELYARLVETSEPGSPDAAVYQMRQAEAAARARTH